MRLVLMLALSFIVAGGSAYAQAGDPVSEGVKQLYDSMQLNITESAELVSEADYGFKPTPDVRSFGELIGHIANSQYFFCSAVKAEESPAAADYEKDVTAKAELVAGLKASNAYCNGAYEAMADSASADMIKFGRGEVTKAYALVFNVAHINEHYGNLVTYMRLKGLVPPSTARGQM